MSKPFFRPFIAEAIYQVHTFLTKKETKEKAKEIGDTINREARKLAEKSKEAANQIKEDEQLQKYKEQGLNNVSKQADKAVKKVRKIKFTKKGIIIGVSIFLVIGIIGSFMAPEHEISINKNKITFESLSKASEGQPNMMDVEQNPDKYVGSDFIFDVSFSGGYREKDYYNITVNCWDEENYTNWRAQVKYYTEEYIPEIALLSDSATFLGTLVGIEDGIMIFESDTMLIGINPRRFNQ